MSRETQPVKKKRSCLFKVWCVGIGLAIVAGLAFCGLALTWHWRTEEQKERWSQRATEYRDKAIARGEKVYARDFQPEQDSARVAVHMRLATLPEIAPNPSRLFPPPEPAPFHFTDGADVFEIRRREAEADAAFTATPPEYWAFLDALSLPGPPPRAAPPPFDLDRDLMLLEQPHLSLWRMVTRLAATRAGYIAVKHGGDEGLDRLMRDLPVTDLYEDGGMIGWVRRTTRSIMMERAREIAWTGRPTPAALRRCADTLEALPPLGPSWRNDLEWARMINTDLLSRGYAYWLNYSEKSSPEEYKYLKHSVGGTLNPLSSLEKNLLDIYREFDALLAAAEGVDDLARWPQLFPPLLAAQKRLEEKIVLSGKLQGDPPENLPEALQANLTRTLPRDDDAYVGIEARVALIFFTPLNALVHSERQRRLTAAGLRLFADRLEGVPYPDAPDLLDPVTGESAKVLRRDGFYILYMPDLPDIDALFSSDSSISPRFGKKASPTDPDYREKIIKLYGKTIIGPYPPYATFIALPLLPDDEGADEVLWRTLVGTSE